MDLTEFFESGMIEDYCLGVLGPDDMRLVAQLADQHDEIKLAIESYELVLIKYAEDLFE